MQEFCLDYLLCMFFFCAIFPHKIFFFCLSKLSPLLHPSPTHNLFQNNGLSLVFTQMKHYRKSRKRWYLHKRKDKEWNWSNSFSFPSLWKIIKVAYESGYNVEENWVQDKWTNKFLPELFCSLLTWFQCLDILCEKGKISQL